jgi:hypothetical protein
LKAVARSEKAVAREPENQRQTAEMQYALLVNCSDLLSRSRKTQKMLSDV